MQAILKLTSLSFTLPNLLSTRLKNIKIAYRRALTVNVLNKLSDKQLEDIGISRSEIKSFVAKI